MVEIQIEAADDGKQVHKWLRLLLPGMPLSGIYKFVRTGRIKVNKRRAKRDTVLHSGDRVELYMSEEDYETTRGSTRGKYIGVSSELNVKFEDEDCVVVHKPAGILVHAAKGENYASTLQAQVEAYIYRSVSPSRGQAFTPSPVHRLDRNTSGLVIFAKTSRAARNLGQRFDFADVKKLYICLVEGTVRQAGRIDAALSREDESVTTVDVADGKRSITSYEPLDHVAKTSLLWIQIETGRTHQIRAHMAHIEHPLLNDAKYGARRKTGEFFYLHCAALCIPDKFDLTDPLPERFNAKLDNLGYDVDKLRHRLKSDHKWN